MASKNLKVSLIIFSLICFAAGCLFYKTAITNEKDAKRTQQDFVTIKTETPYDAIYQYYKALEGNNWDLVKGLTTPYLWKYIETSNFKRNWENKTAQDPTLKFVLFIVNKESIDREKGTGWVLGKVDWTSQRRTVPDDNRTIFVEKRGASWVISRVVDLPAVEVVDDFYEAVNMGNLVEARRLTTTQYWRKLSSAGVIDGLKRDRSRFFGGVYVVFLVKDFTEKKNEAWVKGDVSWKPLTLQQKEISVNVHLVRDNGWKIDKIIGHWNTAKK